MDFNFSDKYEPLFKLLEARNVVESKAFEFYEDDVKKHWLELSKVDTVLISGGRDCFYPNQEVITSSGAKRIKDISTGDDVLTYNEKTKQKEFNKVSKTKTVKKEETVSIKLKSGSVIKCTLDHEFYHEGSWVSVKDLLSLWYGGLEKDTEV
jgi:hypothetical protein